jgi:hypothetical protein
MAITFSFLDREKNTQDKEIGHYDERILTSLHKPSAEIENSTP